MSSPYHPQKGSGITKYIFIIIIKCITFGGRIYVLQNIDVEGEIDENRRKILCFDGNQWIDLGEGE